MPYSGVLDFDICHNFIFTELILANCSEQCVEFYCLFTCVYGH